MNREFFENYDYSENPDFDYELESHNRPVIPNIHLGIFVAIRDKNLVELMNWINNGEYINFTGFEHVTPILYAAELGYDEGVTALLQTADISIMDDYGRSVFHVAAEFCEKETLEMLKNKMDNYGINFLHITAGDDELLPIDFAVSGGKAENVVYLLENNALTNENKNRVIQLAKNHLEEARRTGIQNEIQKRQAILGVIESYAIILNE